MYLIILDRNISRRSQFFYIKQTEKVLQFNIWLLCISDWLYENTPDNYDIDPYQTLTFYVPISHNSTFKRVVSFQAHTQYEKLSISQTEHQGISTYNYNGSDAGMLVEISQKSKGVQFNVTSGAGEKITVQVVAVIFDPYCKYAEGVRLEVNLWG